MGAAGPVFLFIAVVEHADGLYNDMCGFGNDYRAVRAYLFPDAKTRYYRRNNMIELIHIHKKFGDNTIFNDACACFENGKISGIIGKNGSGKTVLLRLLIGLYYADKGQILVDGKCVGKDMEFTQNVGFIIETPRFLPGFTGRENLAMLARLNHKIGRQEVRNAMLRVGLDPDNKKKLGKYSLGMRQRLGIAQAIMENPDIMILDEPTNALDKEGVQGLRNMLHSFAEEGKTIVLATHAQADIDDFCDQLFEIMGGQLVQRKGAI